MFEDMKLVPTEPNLDDQPHIRVIDYDPVWLTILNWMNLKGTIKLHEYNFLCEYEDSNNPEFLDLNVILDYYRSIREYGFTVAVDNHVSGKPILHFIDIDTKEVDIDQFKPLVAAIFESDRGYHLISKDDLTDHPVVKPFLDEYWLEHVTERGTQSIRIHNTTCVYSEGVAELTAS